MTLAEIEILLRQLQEQVTANTAAITTLQNNLTQYATTDDLKTLSTQVNILLDNNDTLQEAVAALDTSVKKIDHLETLLDVDVNNITENDVLQYSNRGKWQNIQPSMMNGLISNSSTGASNLNDLSDIMLTNVTDGQFLVYDAQLGYWTNKTIDVSGGADDLGNYMTFADAKRLYLPLTGGTLTGPLTVKALVTAEDNVIVHKALTMYDY